MPATEALEVAAFNFLIDCKSRRLSLPSFVTVTASGGLAVAPTSVQAAPFVVRFKLDDQEVAQRLRRAAPVSPRSTPIKSRRAT